VPDLPHNTQPVFWAERAWLPEGWREGVLLRTDARGHWAEVRPGVIQAPEGATVLPGPVLPGLVNAHSHAFQRAFAGLAERRDSDADDFWSWRDRMYGVALGLDPAQLQAVAAQLYVEMLRGGYTQVCEFHYLHHSPDGQPYADPAQMSWSLTSAAETAGIGLTVLPVLYERAGFSQPGLRDDQRRFRGTAQSVHALYNAVNGAARPLVNAGVAIHSLRAARPESISDLMQRLGDDAAPVHIHVSEQTAEVDDCVATTGQRPIEWLCAAQRLDARWQLVHATHTVPAEIDAVARSGAGVVICPTTEANLGDGLCDLPHWLQAGVPLALGSDSQVSRRWCEELRWLEYGQRLHLRQRNVAASPSAGQPATAERLWRELQSGHGHVAGLNGWGLLAGARADLLVLNSHAPGLHGAPRSHTLDALVFATDAPAFAEVFVAGQRVLEHGRHAHEDDIANGFAEAMEALWGTAPSRA
jgi:formimidoylglutamate deiminase